MAEQAETPTRREDDGSPGSGFSPSIVASSTVTAVRGGGGGLEHQLRVLQSLHSSGLLDSEVFAKQQDALLNDWRHTTSNEAVSVFDGGASKELASHCQRLRAALEQRLARAKSRQLDYAASKEAATKLEHSAAAEAAAHREAISAVFRDGRVALQRKEQELIHEVELRRDSALQSLAAQQEELVDSLAQHSESAALIRTAMREDDARSFLAGHAQLCARLETEEAIAESLYEAQATPAHPNRWSIPNDLVPSTVAAATAAAAAVGFGQSVEPVPEALPGQWEPPPVISADTGAEDAQQDSEEATVRRRAAEGDAESLYILGGWLHQGTREIRSNRAEAEMHYRQAAAQGHSEAACALGCMLIEPLADPETRHQHVHGVKTLAEALALLRQAADAGVLEAHYNLGCILSGELDLGGEGIRDVEQAIEHYRVAAHGGDGMSKLSVGSLLADSATTTVADGDDGGDARTWWSEALDWWKQALEDPAVSAEAAVRLGNACERDAEMLSAEIHAAEGKTGGSPTPADTRLVLAGMHQALDYYRQAAGAGHPLADKEVARLLAALPSAP